MRRVPVALLALALAAVSCSPVNPGREREARRRERGSHSQPTEGNQAGTSAAPGSSPSPAELAPESDRPWWKKRIDKLIRKQPFSLQVRHGGGVLYSNDARNKRVPASVEKLVLSFALFEEFGPRETFPTRLAARRREGHRVPGDLWVIGSGDPSISGSPAVLSSFPAGATDLQELVRALRQEGVTRIGGDVVASTTPFARDWFAPGWRPYFPVSEVGLPSALAFNGNVHKGRYTPRPELFLAKSLRKRLKRSGISVAGNADIGPAPRGLKTIAAVESPPLSTLARFMNHESSNFFAEVLGKALAVARFGSPGRISKGARAIRAYARSEGISLEAYDSSGLSYANRMSPMDVTHLLEEAKREPWGGVLRRGLARGGRGTLEDRLHDVRLRAKTGTLVDISTLAGWVWLKKAKSWAEFAIFSRNVEKFRAMQIEDAIVRTLHNYAR